MASRVKDQPGGQVAPRAEWLPIETAPTDKRLLLWCADMLGDFVRDAATGRKVRQPYGIVFGRVFTYAGVAPQAHGEGLNGNWTFTHWMPLPDPPK